MKPSGHTLTGRSKCLKANESLLKITLRPAQSGRTTTIQSTLARVSSWCFPTWFQKLPGFLVTLLTSAQMSDVHPLGWNSPVNSALSQSLPAFAFSSRTSETFAGAVLFDLGRRTSQGCFAVPGGTDCANECREFCSQMTTLTRSLDRIQNTANVRNAFSFAPISFKTQPFQLFFFFFPSYISCHSRAVKLTPRGVGSRCNRTRQNVPVRADFSNVGPVLIS